MSEQTNTRYSSSSKYTAPAEEWAALLGLAGQAIPARAIAAGCWLLNYFTSEASIAASTQIAAATTPLLVELPVDQEAT